MSESARFLAPDQPAKGMGAQTDQEIRTRDPNSDRAGDGGEEGGDVRAQKGRRGGHDDRDQRDQEAVLNHRRGVFTLDELLGRGNDIDHGNQLLKRLDKRLTMRAAIQAALATATTHRLVRISGHEGDDGKKSVPFRRRY
jgi:hypothetical protein